MLITQSGDKLVFMGTVTKLDIFIGLAGEADGAGDTDYGGGTVRVRRLPDGVLPSATDTPELYDDSATNFELVNDTTTGVEVTAEFSAGPIAQPVDFAAPTTVIVVLDNATSPNLRVDVTADDIPSPGMVLGADGYQPGPRS